MAEESFIILNDVLVEAANSVSFSTKETQQSNLLLNATGFNRKIASPPKTTCSIKKSLINNDFIKTLTGITNLSGQFIHGDKALDFSDGVISNYSVSVMANDLPSISFKIDIYGDFKPGTKKNVDALNKESGVVDVDATGFFINIDNSTNFIQDFNYSVNFNISPTYEIDSIKSSTVKILPPVTYDANVNFEVNNETLDDVTGLINTETFNRTVVFASSGSGVELNRFEVPNASLRSQSISQSAGDTEKINLSFNGYST